MRRTLARLLPILVLLAGCGDRDGRNSDRLPEEPDLVVARFLAEFHEVQYASLVAERESAEWTTEGYRAWLVNQSMRYGRVGFGKPRLRERDAAAGRATVDVEKTTPPTLERPKERSRGLRFHLTREATKRWRIVRIAWVCEACSGSGECTAPGCAQGETAPLFEATP